RNDHAGQDERVDSTSNRAEVPRTQQKDMPPHMALDASAERSPGQGVPQEPARPYAAEATHGAIPRPTPVAEEVYKRAREIADDDEELNRRERRETRLEHISVAYAATALGLTRVPTSDIPSRRRVFLSETQLEQTPQEPHSGVPGYTVLSAQAPDAVIAASTPSSAPESPPPATSSNVPTLA